MVYGFHRIYNFLEFLMIHVVHCGPLQQQRVPASAVSQTDGCCVVSCTVSALCECGDNCCVLIGLSTVTVACFSLLFITTYLVLQLSVSKWSDYIPDLCRPQKNRAAC